MEALAKDCEFVNLRGVHPPLKAADKIKFVEEIQRSESDYKQLGRKYAKFLRNETAMRSNQWSAWSARTAFSNALSAPS
jgi:hypothetical protein